MTLLIEQKLLVARSELHQAFENGENLETLRYWIGYIDALNSILEVFENENTNGVRSS